MNGKRLASILALALLATAVLATTAGGVPKVPSIPKGALPVEYPVTLETTGSIDYTWTYDTTSKCSPGYRVTVTEKLTFDGGKPRRAKLAIVGSKAFTTAAQGGSWKLDVRLASWKETNYCDGPPAKITEPTCRDLNGGEAIFLVGPEGEGPEKPGLDPLAPIVQNTNFMISATKPISQDRTCWEDRPEVETIGESDRDWAVDPSGGISVPLGVPSSQFRSLGVGQKIHRHITVSGRCDGATARASSLPANIVSCAISGHIDARIKRIR
jgi:hypothetical protein